MLVAPWSILTVSCSVVLTEMPDCTLHAVAATGTSEYALFLE